LLPKKRSEGRADVIRRARADEEDGALLLAAFAEEALQCGSVLREDLRCLLPCGGLLCDLTRGVKKAALLLFLERECKNFPESVQG
jgi:hypothetical protein